MSLVPSLTASAARALKNRHEKAENLLLLCCLQRARAIHYIHMASLPAFNAEKRCDPKQGAATRPKLKIAMTNVHTSVRVWSNIPSRK